MDLVNSPPAPSYIIVSIGIALWTDHQKIVEDARREGQLGDESEFFEGAFYLSPELPREFMQEFVESLEEQDNVVRYYINKASHDEVVELIPWSRYQAGMDGITPLQ